jgi:signal transduction histidine kinase/CheY-like chemotaxis protein
MLTFVAAICAAAVALWWLDQRQPALAPWFVIAFLLVAVHVGVRWLALSGLTMLVALPAVLAAALISLRTGVAIAAFETLLLATGAGSVNASLTLFAILTIWTSLGALAAAVHPLRQAAQWSWENFSKAQRELDQARERNADLDRVLGELLHANRQLNLLNERIAALRAVAEEAQRTKAAFVAKVSHEFRTPLNMIIGLTDLLVETPDVYGERLPPALLEDLRIVHRNCEHLANMVNDVLDLSQTEAGRLTLRKEWGNLAEDVHLAVDAVRPLAQKKGVRLAIHTSADLPPVFYDRTRIRQVLLNLVSNAARYTETGEILVTVVCEQRQVGVNVSDTGPGIPPEDVERIFEPFYQGAGALDRAREGSGLGLSISKQLVESHDGRLWLASQVGVGTTFFVRLPMGPLPAPVARPEGWIREEWMWLQRESRPATPTLPPRLRIVFYDETAAIRALRETMGDNVEFVEAITPDDVGTALAAAPAHALLLNAATTDALLPLLSQLRRQALDTPVIGCVMPSPIDHALAAGALEYLIKPVTRADLRAALAMVNRPVRQILVVDDDPDVRQLLARMLRSLDRQLVVTTAGDGEAAWRALEASPIDLILLDLMLVQETGWNLLARLRQTARLCTIPVIIVSAQDPTDQPTNSDLLIVTMDEGITPTRLLRCVQQMSATLLAPN